MSKYFTIAKSKTQVEFSHRANVIAYVGGNLLDLFIQVVVWTAIFSASDIVSGYTRPEMMTYVIVGWAFMYLSTNYGYEEYIKKDIHEGRLSGFLVKPVNYLSYIASHAAGRAVFAFFLILAQTIFFLYFFRASLVFNSSPAAVLVFILMFFAAYLIKFYLAVLIGFLSFWSSDVNGTYYTLNIMSRFLSGAFFPIALLPPLLAKISYFFPFIYTYFLPLQFYLGKISFVDGLKALGAQAAWIAVLYLLIKTVWKRGLLKYEGTGI